jgi:hypothetical protein
MMRWFTSWKTRESTGKGRNSSIRYRTREGGHVQVAALPGACQLFPVGYIETVAKGLVFGVSFAGGTPVICSN